MHVLKERNFGLDLIRAMAIILVVASHCTYLLFPIAENSFTTLIRVLGATGVDLFFILSGFLIGNILLKNIDRAKIKFNNLFTFWKRRWLRTLPNYFLILLLNIILFAFLEIPIPKEIGRFFIFVQNFINPQPDFFTESWSLSIEEFAYLFLPLLIYVFFYFMNNKNKKKTFLWVTIISIIVLTLVKFKYYLDVNVDTYKAWSSGYRKVVIYRVDAIYFGFILAYIFEKYRVILRKNKHFIALSGLFLFVILHAVIYVFDMLPQTHLWFYVFVYLQMVVISFGLLFPFFIDIKYVGFLKNTVSFISTRSYAIYLINYSLVLLTIQKFIDLPATDFYVRFLVVFVFLFTTTILSEILFRFFEQPIMRYRDKNIQG